MKEETAEGQLTYTPSKYSKSLHYYAKTQIKVVMPFLVSIAKSCQYASQYPVCKVLRAVSKIFLLNQIQVIFLAYLIRETKWDIQDKIIHSNAQHVQDIVCYTIQNPNYKRLILYLLVTAYTVKYYLNEKTTEAMDEAVKKCPSFKIIFQSWAKKHAQITSKINPRTLNTIYQHLFTRVRDNQPDYNIVVDAILQISPAYNPQKEKNFREQRKKINQKNNIKLEESVKQERSGFFPNNPLFSSSGIIGLIHHCQYDQQRKQSNSGLNPFHLNKSSGNFNRGLFGSSMYKGINSGFDVKDDDYGELYLGLQEGQSQQNIVIDEPRNLQRQNQPNNSVISINMSKALSLASKYISTEGKVDGNDAPSE